MTGGTDYEELTAREEVGYFSPHIRRQTTQRSTKAAELSDAENGIPPLVRGMTTVLMRGSQSNALGKPLQKASLLPKP